MSKEFEEIVLRKLEVLEETTQNTAERLGVLEETTQNTAKRLGVLEEITQNTAKKSEVLEETTQNTAKKSEVLEETTQNIAKKLDALEETTQKMQKENAKKFGEIEIELRDTREIVKSLSENFARFDYEINKKIDTLFDAYTVNKEKNEVHEGDIVSLNEKVFNHDIRISNLEDKILTA